MSIVAHGSADVGLGVQVQQRLAQRVQPGDPHLGRGEGVHPGDHADAVRIGVGLQHDPADRAGVGEHRLPDDRRPADRRTRRACSAICLRTARRPGQRLLAVQALAAGEEPDLRLALVGGGGHVGSCPSTSVVLAVDVLVAVDRGGRCRPAAIGTGSPSWRATCTVRATSSTHHGGLHRGPGVAADGEGAVVLHQHRRERCPRSVSTMPRPMESSPISANGPTGISPPNSSAIMVSTHGIGFAARGPGRGVGRVGVHDAADLRHVPVDVGVRGGVARRCVRRPRRSVPSRSQTTMSSGGELVVATPRRLDHHQVAAGHPRGDVAGGPDHQLVAGQLGVQLRHGVPQLGDGGVDVTGHSHGRSVSDNKSRRQDTGSPVVRQRRDDEMCGQCNPCSATRRPRTQM